MTNSRKNNTDKTQSFWGKHLRTFAKVSLATVALIFGGAKKAEASGSPMRSGVQRTTTTVVQQAPVEHVAPVTQVTPSETCTPQVVTPVRSEPVSVRGMTPAPALTRRVSSTRERPSCGGRRVVSAPTVRGCRPTSTVGMRTGGGYHTPAAVHPTGHSARRGPMMERHVGYSGPRSSGRPHAGPAMTSRVPRGGHSGMRTAPHGGYHGPKAPSGGRKIRPQGKGRPF